MLYYINTRNRSTNTNHFIYFLNLSKLSFSIFQWLQAKFFILVGILLLSSISLLFHVSNATFVLPIWKDDKTSQYFTSILIGTPRVRVNLFIDLAAQWSWFTCDLYSSKNSSTFNPLPCDATICDTYNGITCVGKHCGVEAYSPLARYVPYYEVMLGEDVISLYNQTSLNRRAYVPLPRLPLACSDTRPLTGLSSHVRGVLTLARNRVSLQYQISSTFKVPPKFALCLPASSTSSTYKYNGAMYFGGGPYYLRPSSTIDISKSLVTTPLLVSPRNTALVTFQEDPSNEYFINVTSIEVDGTPLHIDQSVLLMNEYGIGGTKISTTNYYTMLHGDIYDVLIDVFVNKAKAMNITRVASVEPFGACFDAKTIANTATGPRVPIIDMILDGKSSLLHNKKARWRIYGANSMVKVSNSVLCLAFVAIDSIDFDNSVVIGGKQMEDNLVEIDLENNKFGITSSLLRKGTSCSQFKGL